MMFLVATTFCSAYFCRRTHILSTVKGIQKNHALIFSPNIRGLEWTLEIPSFGCIIVLNTGIYFIAIPHDKVDRKTLLFTVIIPLKVCTQLLEKYVDNELAATDLVSCFSQLDSQNFNP